MCGSNCRYTASDFVLAVYATMCGKDAGKRERRGKQTCIFCCRSLGIFIKLLVRFGSFCHYTNNLGKNIVVWKQL